jgi:hypothetical protein
MRLSCETERAGGVPGRGWAAEVSGGTHLGEAGDLGVEVRGPGLSG